MFNLSRVFILMNIFLFFLLLNITSFGNINAEELNTGSNVIISEVQFDVVDEGEEEWFELYNPTQSNIDISGWSISDNKESNLKNFPENTSINSGGYLLVIKKASLIYGVTADIVMDVEMGGSFALANTSDSLVLRDSEGNTIDYLAWTSGTGEGVSLERNKNSLNYILDGDELNSNDISLFSEQENPTPKAGGYEVYIVNTNQNTETEEEIIEEESEENNENSETENSEENNNEEEVNNSNEEEVENEELVNTDSENDNISGEEESENSSQEVDNTEIEETESIDEQANQEDVSEETEDNLEENTESETPEEETTETDENSEEDIETESNNEDESESEIENNEEENQEEIIEESEEDDENSEENLNNNESQNIISSGTSSGGNGGDLIKFEYKKKNNPDRFMSPEKLKKSEEIYLKKRQEEKDRLKKENEKIREENKNKRLEFKKREEELNKEYYYNFVLKNKNSENIQENNDKKMFSSDFKLNIEYLNQKSISDGEELSFIDFLKNREEKERLEKFKNTNNLILN